jgi:dTDP-4-amino-4,6-dideoxygalactose transaminase
MLNTSFPPWPSFTKDEANAVSDVILSNKVNYWTGTECRNFENEFAQWVGVKHAIALANGTVALDLALKGLNIGPGDEVVVTPRTFIASISCVVSAGAIPVFADVDHESGNISADTISKVLTTKTKAIICVHLAGWPCDMDPIMDLANKNKLFVIEDCAQAHGAKYKGRSVGSIGHIGAWSFCQDKIMTTGGEGGMVTTNDASLWRNMWAYKDHGKSYEAIYERDHHTPGFRWVHEGFGTNWRMLEVQAVIGRIQLKRMKDWHEARLSNANTIWDFARTLPGIKVPTAPISFGHAAYKCYLFTNPLELKTEWTRDKIMLEIQAKGVPCSQGSCSEVYLEKAFDGTSWRPKEALAVAKDLGNRTLAFLVHPTLERRHIEQTCAVLRDVMLRACR